MKNTSRRHFLKLVSMAGLLPVLGAQLATLGRRAWADALALIDMTKTKRKDPANEKAVGVAQGLGYVEDADAADKAGKIKRTDKPLAAGGTLAAKAQYCKNCFFFDEAKLNGSEPGLCKLIPGVLVHAKGFCNTYNPSPKAKA